MGGYFYWNEEWNIVEENDSENDVDEAKYNKYLLKILYEN